MRIENIGKDKYVGKLYKIGSNVITTKLKNWDSTFPLISPHQSEIRDAEAAKIGLNCTTAQFVYRPRKVAKITSGDEKTKVINQYKSLLEEYPHLLWDFYYQFYPGFPPNKAEIATIIEIQRDAGARIISYYEPNCEQSVEKFKEQLEEFKENNRGYTLSPTLDMGIKTIGMFKKKLFVILELGFQRFNVIYRSIFERQTNWIELSQTLFGTDVWCNVVGIPQRYLSKVNPISMTSIVFLYGVHSASLGYPIIANNNSKTKYLPKTYNFNSTTHKFEVSSITNEQSRAKSINAQISQLKISHTHIINETFYSKFVKSKSSLFEILQSIT